VIHNHSLGRTGVCPKLIGPENVLAIASDTISPQPGVGWYDLPLRGYDVIQRSRLKRRGTSGNFFGFLFI